MRRCHDPLVLCRYVSYLLPMYYDNIQTTVVLYRFVYYYSVLREYGNIMIIILKIKILNRFTSCVISHGNVFFSYKI